MTIAEEYLKKLQEREPQLFPEPLKRSTLTDEDLLVIEKSLGHKLPEQYKEFLQSYQLSDITVYLSFLGDVFGDSGRTFSREENDYVEADDEQPNMLMDMEWHNVSGANAAEWLERLEENDFINGCDAVFREAGYLYLGAIDEGYFILYDLEEGNILYLYHESVYDIGYEYGDEVILNGGMPEKLREGVYAYGGAPIYKDFNDFLRHICLGEHYDETDKVFVDEEDLVNYQ